MEACKNCGTQFEGNFCPNCGQRPNSGRIIFRESAKDVLEHYFDFDTPLLRTITGLITRPGKLIKEYITGKRKSYSHPLRYYILILAIYLIVQNLVNFDPIALFGEILGAKEQPNAQTPATKGSYLFRNNINLFLLLFALFLALLNKLFFRKEKYFFVEYFALGLFIVSQYIFFNLFVIPLTMISPYFFLINYLLVLIYPIYVIVSFHEGKFFAKLVKSFFLVALSWVLYVVSGQYIAVLIVTLFGL